MKPTIPILTIALCCGCEDKSRDFVTPAYTAGFNIGAMYSINVLREHPHLLRLSGPEQLAVIKVYYNADTNMTTKVP